MTDNIKSIQSTLKIKSDTGIIKNDNGNDTKITAGDVLTHFIGGDPDITEDVTFIGVDEDDSLLFLRSRKDRDKDYTISVIDDIENLFTK